MISRRILAAALLLCAIVPVQAQKIKTVLLSEISANFPDQTTGAITPAIARTTFNDFVNSWQQFGGVNQQLGTSYTVQLSDYGQLVTLNNSGSVAVSLPQATGSFGTFNFYASNLGSGLVTITPTISTINGSPSLALTKGQSAWIVSDGTNYQILSGLGSGFVTSSLSGQIAYYPGNAASVSGNQNVNISNGQLTLGQAGSQVGSSCYQNLSSSTAICIQAPSTGQLSSTIATLVASANSYNLVGDSLTQTLTNKTINGANNTLTVRIGSDISGLGTGVATALAVNANASGGFPTITPTTWTPTLTCGTGAVAAYTTQVGSYEAIGRHVTARFTVTINGLGTCSGAITLAGLPVTVANTASDTGACVVYPTTAVTLDASYTYVYGLPVINTTTASLQEGGSGQAINTVRSGMLTAAASFVGFCEYHS